MTYAMAVTLLLVVLVAAVGSMTLLVWGILSILTDCWDEGNHCLKVRLK
jgi:hypothetical protein